MADQSKLLANKITAVVMAAGFSRRFGQDEDKLLINVEGRPLYQHVLKVLEEIEFLEVIVIARQEAILAYADSLGFTAIRNDRAHEGISASIGLGLAEASDESLGYMFFTSDQPYLSKVDVESLIEAFEGLDEQIILARVGGKNGSPTLFSRSYKDQLMSLKGDQGGRVIIKENPHCLSYVELSNPKALWDLDTKEDLLSIAIESRLK